MTIVTPVLETERLRLRGFRAEDHGDYAAIVGDPEVRRLTFHPPPMSEREAWNEMVLLNGQWTLRGVGLWAVEERASGRVIGTTGFFEPHACQFTDFSWMLSRAQWGRGLATEAAARALAWMSETRARPRVVSLVHVDNRASFAVARRLGLAYRSEHLIHGRRWHMLSRDTAPEPPSSGTPGGVLAGP